MPRSLFLSVLLGLFIFSQRGISADSGTPQTPPYPRNDFKDLRLTVNANAPNLVLEWPDGRRAESRITLSKPFSITARMTVGDNECFPQASVPNCKLSGSGAVLYTGIIWVRHPDASRLGKPVEFDLNFHRPGTPQTADSANTETKANGKMSANFFISHFVDPAKLQPIFKIPSDTIACENYEWLTGSRGAPASVDIQSLCVGSMGKNPETDLNENNFDSCSESVHFERNSNFELELKALGAQQQEFVDMNAFGLSEPIGGVTSWEKLGATGVCQITTTLQDPPNLNDLLKLFLLVPSVWEPAQPMITKELQDRLELLPQHPILNNQDRNGFTGVFK